MIAFRQAETTTETAAPIQLDEASGRLRPVEAEVAPPTAPPGKRPISQARLEANRRNARLSRGPRTAKGKARARMNALKHGLFTKVLPKAESPLLVDKAEHEQLITELREDFQPQTQLELLLIESLAFELMRLRHIHALEATIWEDGRPQSDEERRARDGIDIYLGKKTVAEHETDRAFLARMLHAITDGRDEPFTDGEVTHLAALLQGSFENNHARIERVQQSVQAAEERLAQAKDETKIPGLKEWLERDQEHLASAIEHEKKYGAAALGCGSADAITHAVRHSSQIASELKERWRELLTNWILGTDSRLGDAAGFQRRLVRLRHQRIHDLLQRTPELERMGRYEVMVRRNIDRTIHQLHMVRHDLFVAE